MLIISIFITTNIGATSDFVKEYGNGILGAMNGVTDAYACNAFGWKKYPIIWAVKGYIKTNGKG